MNKKLFTSLSIFFPFFNDEGTVEIQIKNAYEIGHQLTDDLEVIAIHGGNSSDKTWENILKMKKIYPKLIVIDKKYNTEGYAVIKYGFLESTKDYIFYTDGDYQYHLEKDLRPLAKKMVESNADVANGYKKRRSDNVVRKFLGKGYSYFSKYVFELPIKDTDCDFRIIKQTFLKRIQLESKNASILPELIKKLHLLGAKFVEMPVSHFNRVYGVSNYSPFSLLKEKLVGDFKLYLYMRKLRAIEDKLRVLRFTLVGVLSLLIQIIIFNLLIIYFNLNRALATFLSDQLPILISFYINSKFTFKISFKKLSIKGLSKFIKYYLIVGVSTFIQTSVVLIGTTIFGNSILISNLFLFVGLFFAFLWNYLLQSRIVWKEK
jgi:putative flippase GtrA